ncbi:zinc finger RNA-binding protein-like [Centruroides sculpturatus]|uniref:zinc finger RNA-binding protein-like n=1 Tax=Centruroides sculpturatus TaxID=218467 RepID=UPI000C6D1DFC|nr:zinc finger RNA-binding protein-like [Centruroides sculpturatus]
MSDDVLKCDLCKKSFSGVVPYSQHLKSAKHLKKKNQIELEATIKLPVTEEGKLFCTLCNMKFSGVIPFQQHMNGSTHMKNVRRQDVMKDICYNLNPKQTGFKSSLKDKKKMFDDGYFSSASSCSSGSTHSSMNSGRFGSNNSFNSFNLPNQSQNVSLDPGVELQKMYECKMKVYDDEQSGVFQKHSLLKESVPTSSNSHLWDEFYKSSVSRMGMIPEMEPKLQGCEICNIPFFSNQEEIIQHLQSDEHFIQKLRTLKLTS